MVVLLMNAVPMYCVFSFEEQKEHSSPSPSFSLLFPFLPPPLPLLLPSFLLLTLSLLDPAALRYGNLDVCILLYVCLRVCWRWKDGDYYR